MLRQDHSDELCVQADKDRQLKEAMESANTLVNKGVELVENELTIEKHAVITSQRVNPAGSQ